MADATDRQLEIECSRALFGHSYVLPTVLWISARPDGRFFLQQISRELGVSGSAVAVVLNRLRRLGLIRDGEPDIPAGGRGRSRKWLEIVPGTFWSAMPEIFREYVEHELGAAIDAAEAADADRRAAAARVRAASDLLSQISRRQR